MLFTFTAGLAALAIFSAAVDAHCVKFKTQAGCQRWPQLCSTCPRRLPDKVIIHRDIIHYSRQPKSKDWTKKAQYSVTTVPIYNTRYTVVPPQQQQQQPVMNHQGTSTLHKREQSSESAETQANDIDRLFLQSAEYQIHDQASEKSRAAMINFLSKRLHERVSSAGLNDADSTGVTLTGDDIFLKDSGTEENEDYKVDWDSWEKFRELNESKEPKPVKEFNFRFAVDIK